ncbi:SusC/RagA family TonB-linked outer membrane protein [Gaoshiqia sp. Z1-71]|uniref:SusC/RagA family TonB-linked outer membrane protein n=1 Tax=Gaoshiqia hydrogeniformans TaxID=3290090 RepID=UPI003BF8C587
MKMIQRKFRLVFLLLACAMAVQAQTAQEKEVSGMVTDPQDKPLIGVAIIVKNQPTKGVVTDAGGRFKIKTGLYEILEIRYIGFKTTELPVVTVTGPVVVVMEEDSESLEEVVVTAAGIIQRKATLSGAITTVDMKTMKTPTSSISNALVGNVTGIIGRQTTGEPGRDNTEFWVRGISTFGANASALILVDGIERSLNELNVEDIESFSVLKDASATAIYGSRGANGVVLITTKRGTAGKAAINFKAEYGYDTRSRTPDYVDGATYARMANEARMTRYQDPVYSEQDLEIIARGLDPDLFPNVDWADVILKDGAVSYRGTLSFRGGGPSARYYVSGSYYNKDGMYKTNDALNDYNTNATYERYNYRANVDLDLTRTTLFRIGVGGYLVDENKPGMSSDDIWGSISNLTPLTVPRMYSNGLIPTYGSGNTMNPEVQLTQTGYQTNWENKVETNITLEQKLDFITPGLLFAGTFSFDNTNVNTITRSKNPELWLAERRRDANGDLVMKRVREASLMSQSGSASGERRYYTEARVQYDKTIDAKHRLGGLLMYYQQERSSTINSNDVKASIPYRNMAFSGRVTYGYKDRYLTDFNFGYTGSENFEKGERFGFFPAISGAWVISQEPFVKDRLPWLNMFKLRYSYGEVGNDQIGSDRFPYMSFIGTSTSMNWGEYGSNGVQGYRITTMGSSNLTWEKAQKHNLGIDLILFDSKLSATADVFRDKRSDIFMRRSQMPYSTGLQDLQPWANIGEMKSEGIDGQASYTHKLGEVAFTLRGNFTYAKTIVLNYDEADNALPYQMTKGYRLNQTRGLIALGLFKDQEEIDNSPVQTFGSYLPGDIRYKDVNGDGVIDDKDVVPIGYTTQPNLSYGFGCSLSWKDFDFNILFQGSGKSDFFLGGNSIYPFNGGETGNILSKVADPGDRWISREISGDPATENPNALLPRLSYGGNANNYRNSTFWLRDGSYLRLKSLEFGYNFPRKYLARFFAESARIGFIGYNLLVFSAFDWWDPEIGSSDGARYPITKTYSLNLTVNF